MSVTHLIFGVALFAMVGLVSTSLEVSSNAPMRVVEIRLTDHRPGIDDFKWLNVGFKSLAVHRKGVSRKTGWIDLIGPTTPVDIVPLKDGRFKVLGTRDLPAGRYDALRVQFLPPEGELHVGKTPPLVVKDTIVAINLDLRTQSDVPILVDLYAENLTDHTPKTYSVKVKEVRVGG